MKRLWKIFCAKVKCNSFCMWRALRDLNFLCELDAYDSENKLILVAAIEKSMLDGEIKLIKVFYKE